MQTYKTEFPSFGELDVEIPSGFKDDSQHGDACPSFIMVINEEVQIKIYIDYKDVEKREMVQEYRFVVDSMNPETEEYWEDLQTNEWSEVLEFIAGYVK